MAGYWPCSLCFYVMDRDRDEVSEHAKTKNKILGQ